MWRALPLELFQRDLTKWRTLDSKIYLNLRTTLIAIFYTTANRLSFRLFDRSGNGALYHSRKLKESQLRLPRRKSGSGTSSIPLFARAHSLP
jgi:hypothetical protein